MVTITPREYAYIRDYIQENPDDEIIEERKTHLKKELGALLKLATVAHVILDITELHKSILMDNKEWDDWADNYIRDLRTANNKHIGA